MMLSKFLGSALLRAHGQPLPSLFAHTAAMAYADMCAVWGQLPQLLIFFGSVPIIQWQTVVGAEFASMTLVSPLRLQVQFHDWHASMALMYLPPEVGDAVGAVDAAGAVRATGLRLVTLRVQQLLRRL
jgi:hypothetical protein